MSFPRGAELLRRVLDSRLLDVHTALPCQVKAFDATAQTVDAQPLIKNVISDPDGTQLEESYPLLRSVPVIYPRCGAFLLVFPLVVGDVVTVLFNERSIDYYMERDAEVHPIDLERHSFQGAVALVGGPYATANPVSETIDGLVIGHDTGAVIRIKDDGTIEIGASASAKQPVALGDDTETEIKAVRDNLNDLVNAFNIHMHATAAPGPPIIPTVNPTGPIPALPPAAVGDVGSSKVDVEE